MKNNWIEISVPALVYRAEVPPMDQGQEDAFKANLAAILGDHLPAGSDWLDCVSIALKWAGVAETEGGQS